MISDLCEAAAVLLYGSRHSGFVPHGLYGKSKPLEDTISGYYLRVNVDDQPGVLAQVATAIGQRGIGISSVIQPEDLEDTSGSTVLVLMIHEARMGDMQAALEAISALECVQGDPVWMRVETLQR